MLGLFLALQHPRQIGKGVLQLAHLVLPLAALGPLPLFRVAAHGLAQPDDGGHQHQVHDDRHHQEHADVEGGQTDQGLPLEGAAQLIALHGPYPQQQLHPPPASQLHLHGGGGHQARLALLRHPGVEEFLPAAPDHAVEVPLGQIALQRPEISVAALQEGGGLPGILLRAGEHLVVGIPGIPSQVGQKAPAHHRPAQHRQRHQSQEHLPGQMGAQPAYAGKAPAFGFLLHVIPSLPLPPQTSSGSQSDSRIPTPS